MSLLTPELSASPVSAMEMNPMAFISPQNGASATPQFGDVLATLQPLVDAAGAADGQALAAPALPAGPLDWAPALTVQALGEHLQLITPGAESGMPGSLEDFARAQGLDESTIGWLMGQAPGSDSTGGLLASLPPGQPAAGPLSVRTAEVAGDLTTGGLPSVPLSSLPAVTAGSMVQPSAILTTAALTRPGPADAANAASTTVRMALPLDAPGTEGMEGEVTPAGTASGAPSSAGPSTAAPSTTAPYDKGMAAAQGTAVPALTALGAATGALWGELHRPRTVTPGTGNEGVAGRAEPTESLMATLRTPAATALMGLQRQLQAAGTPAPAAAAAKAATNLRVSDLDLSQSLASPGMDSGPDLQNLLTEWSARLDSAAAGESGHAPALAAARGQGAMANTPLGLVPPGSEPQLGIDLADKFEQLAEKMGQAVAQRMLSEIEKGHWHLKLMLRPATLGHIEVEMRMRSGELDASFVASQNLTRELLQESLPRLRETLTQLGMDVANMNVDSGRSQQGDGEPTPRAQATQAGAANAAQPAQATVITPRHTARHGQEGWDVMV